jgi:hypothetical protein
MTSEHGYIFPEASDDTRCECGKESDGLCERCEEPSCLPICHACQDKVEAIELDHLWGGIYSRKPEDILHSAWTHSQNGRDISTPEHQETVWIFKASLAMIRAGWSEAA